MCVCSVAQSSLTPLCDPLDCSPLNWSSMGFFSGKNTGEGCHFPPPGDLPNPGIKPKSPVSPALQVDSLPAEPSGKPH